MISYHDAIEQVTQGVWSDFLGHPLVPGPAPVRPGPVIQAAIAIHGAWEGAVEVRLSPALARLAAAEMCGAAADTLADDQVRDAVGEVANMIGGNLKGLVPAPARLGLPLVAATTGDGPDGDARSVLASAHFECAGEPLSVRLVEGAAPAA